MDVRCGSGLGGGSQTTPKMPRAAQTLRVLECQMTEQRIISVGRDLNETQRGKVESHRAEGEAMAGEVGDGPELLLGSTKNL